MNGQTRLPHDIGAIHFVGIGGIGMSGIAEVLLNHGFTVQGSDAKASPITERLAAKGAMVFVGQKAEIVPEADPSKTATGRVMRIAATFGARKLKSDTANEASDERVVEVAVSVDDASFLIGQRVLVKFRKS